MEMMQCLEEAYGFNEPILLNEVNIDGFTDKYLRQTFSRLVKRGKLVRFDQGVYYIPENTSSGRSLLCPKQVYEKKYIKDKGRVFGFYSGIFFENKIGIAGKVPDMVEIVTNRESSRIREVIIGDQKIRVRKPVLSITGENVEVLQFLDLMNHICFRKMTETSKENLFDYVRKKGFKKEEVYHCITKYPARTAMTLIESRVIDELL